MKKSKIIPISFLSAFGVLIYILIVATIIRNFEKIVPGPDTFWSPVMGLMLFVFSALVTSLSVFGYPIWLYLENEKKDAVKLLLATVCWLFLLLITVFIIGSAWSSVVVS